VTHVILSAAKDRASLAAAAIAVAFVTTSIDARAAGLYFSDRGVRPMGRAGAFVAGADDLNAIWYNPAGLAQGESSLLVDFAQLRFSSSYTRRLKIVDADNTVREVDSPNVEGTSPILPIPTIAGAYAFGPKKEWTVATGVFGPYPALATYPETAAGKPSPARYALGSFDGSALAFTGLWLAWRPVPELRVGVGAEAIVGVFQSEVVFSASPQDRLIGAPEQPEFDAKSRLRVGPIFAPSANAGVIYEPDRHVRVGLSYQLPFLIDAPAKLDVRLPNDVAFDSASVHGRDAQVRFELPAVLRLGVEVRPVPTLRVEAAYVREFWTTHHSIEAVPNGITIDGVTGLPRSVPIPPITYPRSFDNSSSYRLGAEYTFEIGGYTIDLRGGVAYETSAVPRAYLSLQSLDFDKLTTSIGGSLHFGKHWRVDAVYAHVFARSETVSPDEAAIPRVNPLKGNAPFEGVNGGTYSANADLLGVGVNYVF
jgi:long-chain fatty acid transport protein